jgi:hypothetical protein
LNGGLKVELHRANGKSRKPISKPRNNRGDEAHTLIISEPPYLGSYSFEKRQDHTFSWIGFGVEHALAVLLGKNQFRFSRHHTSLQVRQLPALTG